MSETLLYDALNNSQRRRLMDAALAGAANERHPEGSTDVPFFVLAEIADSINSLSRQRDELAEALRFLVSDAEIVTGAMAPERGTELRESCRIARAALAKLEADS